MNEKKSTVDLNLRVPKGWTQEMALSLCNQMYAEMHQVAPLADGALKAKIAAELVGDHEVLAHLRRAILDAPPNAMWGCAVIEPAFVDMPGLEEKGIHIDAYVRMDEAAKHGIQEVMKTATCFAYITSSSTRGLLAMQGYRLRFTLPYVPGADETTGGVEG